MKHLTKILEKFHLKIGDYFSGVYFIFGNVIVNADDHSKNYGARIQGDLTVTGNMENAFNTINNLAETEGKPDLKDRLKDLQAAINKLIPELSKEEAETVARDLRSLTDEVTSSRPRKSIFQATADGLVSAAKSVASMTEPVAKAVKAVIDLFSDS
jgi:ABC-type transporter Mla subunit MlaD